MKKLSKIQESIWSDIQDRSTGEIERKEDIMRPFGIYELMECIKQQYEKQGKGENLDLTMIDVSGVEDMRYLFERLFSSWDSWDNSKTIKHIDMSNWDVSHVKYMDSMFYGCVSIESLEVSDWDVSSVFHMSSMFQNCVNLESIDVSKWKMSSATNLYAMFFRCKKLKTLDVANWDVSNVEVMGEMFSGCKELESLDISNWKPNKLRTANWMFYGCNKLQPVDVSKWDKSKQNKIPARCRKITESVWADIQDRSTGEVERKEDDVNILDGHSMLEYIFNHYEIQDNFSQPQYHKDANVLNVPILKVKKNIYNTSVNYITYDYDKDCIYIRETLYNEILIKIKKELNISSFWGGAYTIKDADNSLFIKLIDFIIDNVDPMSKTVFALLHKRKMNENLWADLQDRSSGEVIRKEDNITSREELDEIIRSAYEEQGEGDTLTIDLTMKKIMVDDLSYLFSDYNNVKHILGLETWDVSNVKDMTYMFTNCVNLTEVNISNWDVSNAKKMNGLFSNCKNLTELHIENWDVRNVKNMFAMFFYCENLQELHIENWDVSNVYDMSNMFSNCKNLIKLDIGDWDVSQVKDMSSMFYGCPIQYVRKGKKLVRK